jgi:L-2-hydroxyglutarate oxidase LhgO
MDYDMVVAGAGVIGLACADALVRTRARPRVLVVEPHASFGQETSSRSSEVVHAGMYYPTGSLKARLCVAANPRFYAYCDAHGVPYAKTGKFIVANSALEERALEDSFARSRERRRQAQDGSGEQACSCGAARSGNFGALVA